MKHELEQSITESIRLFEKMTGKTVRQLQWTPGEKVLTVVVGRPGARVVDTFSPEIGEQ